MKGSKYLSYVGGLSAIAFALAAPSAMAQEAGRDVCQDVGASAPEPLGDRDGHAIGLPHATCKTVEGPMAGAIMTLGGIWEWDGTKAKQLSGDGVSRKPGATEVFQVLDGNLELTMSDGKPTGWTGTGHVQITLATGSAASVNGKTVAWTAKSTGPHEFEMTYTYK